MGYEAFHAVAAADGSLPLALSQRHAPRGCPPRRRGLVCPPPQAAATEHRAPAIGQSLDRDPLDFRALRAEWRAMRVRRALGREFREVERQVLAEHDAPDSQPAVS